MEIEATKVSETRVGDEVAKAFDASPYELLDTAILNVQDASGLEDLMIGGAPVTIEIYGPGSAEAVKMQHSSGRKIALRTAAMFRGKVPNSADTDLERVDKLVAITKTVNNFPYPNGARGIYSNPKLCYIADQVEAFFNDKSNFSKPSSAI